MKEGPDIQMLQTAASVANVAVTTYEAVVGLPSMADIPALAKTFLTKTRDQHGEHSRAFNGAATRLGGVPQNAANRELKKLVDAKLPTLRSPADTLDLLTMIERAAAETYVADTTALEDVEARRIVASVMGVAAQHVSFLSIIKALLATPDLLAVPPAASRLPATISSVGFPDSFLRSDQARPGDEGAVK